MAESLQLFSYSMQAMGSRCEFKFYAPTDQGHFFYQQAYHRLRSLETKYSRYHQDSITSKINATAGTSSRLSLDHETQGLLHYAQVLYEQSDGLFDITSGVLRQAWDFRSNRLPDDMEISQLLPKIGWSKIDWSGAEIRLPEKGMEIDFGGFVKEFAADQIAEVLVRAGIRHGLINLGGDIVIIGPHPSGEPWIVGIQHPRQVGAIRKLAVHQGAIATSGDYERFMIIDGVRYSHLLNPQTGKSIQADYASVSVLAAQCLIAGSFSTIAMLKSEIESDWIQNKGVSYLTVDQQLTVNESR
jgi:FAD:protein FMN transferase